MSELTTLLNNSGYDFFFLVVDKFLDIKIPELSNFYSIHDPQLTTKNSGFLLSQQSTQEFINTTIAKSGHKAAIIPFKPSAKIDKICQKNDWLIISNPASLNRFFEDKIKFFEICQLNKLPTIPSHIKLLTPENFKEAQQKYGLQLVIQTHFGWAGNSSYLVNSYQDLPKSVEPNTLVKYSKFLNGYSLINNCCLTSSGLIQSPPGLQYTGIAALTSNPLATVGRQWPSFTSERINNKIKDITIQFSEILKQSNYKGFFGLDFMVSDDNVYLLECNPRLTASFAFYTYIELKNNIIPLFLFHIAEFIGLKFTDIQTERFNFNHLTGSEITLKDCSGSTIKKYNEFISFSKTCSPIDIPPSVISRLK